MLISMTGHGRAVVEGEQMKASVEVRTVNNRFFKVVMNSDLPMDLQTSIEEMLRKSIARGTVNVRVRIECRHDPGAYRLNAIALQAYRDQIASLDWVAGEPSIDALLTLPGVVDESNVDLDSEAIWPTVQEALAGAVAELNGMRQREGEAMGRNLQDNLGLLTECVSQIEALSPQIVEAFSLRLTDRINSLLEKYDLKIQSSDVVREIGIFAERADLAEELVRLRSHLDLFQRTANERESNGRKLDFVIQEMLRETNTIGSKCGDAAVSSRVVEMKTIIERMREMVQNLE